MSPAEVLALAADKLEVGWTTGAAARDASGRELHRYGLGQSDHPRACSWCSLGAIWAVEADGMAAQEARRAYADYLAQQLGVRQASIADWNDNHCPDQATAVATMRAAAESLQTSTKEPR